MDGKLHDSDLEGMERFLNSLGRHTDDSHRILVKHTDDDRRHRTGAVSTMMSCCPHLGHAKETYRYEPSFHCQYVQQVASLSLVLYNLFQEVKSVEHFLVYPSLIITLHSNEV